MSSSSDQVIVWRRKLLVNGMPFSSATMPHRDPRAPYAPKTSAAATPIRGSRRVFAYRAVGREQDHPHEHAHAEDEPAPKPEEPHTLGFSTRTAGGVRARPPASAADRIAGGRRHTPPSPARSCGSSLRSRGTGAARPVRRRHQAGATAEGQLAQDRWPAGPKRAGV
jgi:hypothetical protein